MEVIVPAAGLSSRFPGTKPKYLLADYKNDLMIANAIRGLVGKYKVHVGILKAHDVKYKASKYLTEEVYSGLNVAVLPEQTLGPADTVYQVIKANKIKPNAEILIRDCDSFFDYIHIKGSAVYCLDLSTHSDVENIANKSFVVVDGETVVAIAEKQVVSERICVGGYKFASAKLFCDLFEQIPKDHEIFVSEVIELGIKQGFEFKSVDVNNHIDVGTLPDWLAYNDKPTIFCDIDGTIIHQQGRHGDNSFGSTPVPLQRNIDALKTMVSKGCQIIFTTARPEKYNAVTRRMLNDLGFSKCQLIMGLNNSYRVLINDYSTLNPCPSAVSINIDTNTDTLRISKHDDIV